MGAAIKIITLLLLFIGFLHVINGISNTYQWHAEWQRKIIHVGLGTLSIGFPWIFSMFGKLSLQLNCIFNFYYNQKQPIL